jgi:hypothetical protein
VSQLQRELSGAVSLMHDEQAHAAQATAQLEAKVTVTVTLFDSYTFYGYTFHKVHFF